VIALGNGVFRYFETNDSQEAPAGNSLRTLAVLKRILIVLGNAQQTESETPRPSAGALIRHVPYGHIFGFLAITMG
jgi:hypothetical protein